MNPSLVTVFILTYRKFENVFHSIQSVLDQDYSFIELLVSDDASPDFPYVEIVSYIESNKRSNIVSYEVLNNKINVGTVKHINNILKKAHGHLYIPLAGDDCFFCNTVVSRIVEKYNSDHFYVLSTSRALYFEEGNYVALMPHYASRKRISQVMNTASQQRKKYTECRDREFASGSAMVYEASFLKQMNYFDEKYRLWEDGPFINKITNLGFSITTDYDIISIKYRGGGVSSGGNPLILSDVELFNKTDRRVCSESFGWYHKRILDYVEKKYIPMGIFRRFLFRIVYLDVFLCQCIYRLQEYYYGKLDLKYIRRLI